MQQGTAAWSHRYVTVSKEGFRPAQYLIQDLRERRKKKERKTEGQTTRRFTWWWSRATAADTVSGSDEDGASVDTTRHDTLSAAVPLIYTRRNWFPTVCVCAFLLLLHYTSDRRRARRGVWRDENWYVNLPCSSSFHSSSGDIVRVCECLDTLSATKFSIKDAAFFIFIVEKKRKEKVKEAGAEWISFPSSMFYFDRFARPFYLNRRLLALVIWLSDAPSQNECRE